MIIILFHTNPSIQLMWQVVQCSYTHLLFYHTLMLTQLIIIIRRKTLEVEEENHRHLISKEKLDCK